MNTGRPRPLRIAREGALKDAHASMRINAVRTAVLDPGGYVGSSNLHRTTMTDLATGFTIIERAIVEWLEASGHAVVHDDGEWLVLGPKWPLVKEQEVSITALTCAIVQALERQK